MEYEDSSGTSNHPTLLVNDAKSSFIEYIAHIVQAGLTSDYVISKENEIKILIIIVFTIHFRQVVKFNQFFI